MSGRKDVLLPYQLFDDVTMQTDLTSAVITIQYLDNVAIQLAWTGNGTGTFEVEGSTNYNSRTPTDAIWTSIALNPIPAASGTADDALLDLNQLSFPYVRLTYDSTFLSGSVTTVADVAGSLNSTYFLLNSVTTYYYIWFNVNGAGVDPALAGKTGVPVALATGATANAVATAIAAQLTLLTTLERVAASTNHVYFNILLTGGSAGAGTSGFTITNVDTTGVLDGFISAKMV